MTDIQNVAIGSEDTVYYVNPPKLIEQFNWLDNNLLGIYECGNEQKWYKLVFHNTLLPTYGFDCNQCSTSSSGKCYCNDSCWSQNQSRYSSLLLQYIEHKEHAFSIFNHMKQNIDHIITLSRLEVCVWLDKYGNDQYPEIQMDYDDDWC